MNYEAFFRAVEAADVSFPFSNREPVAPSRLSNEALFHLPLLAIAVLAIAKGSRKPKTDSIGQLVGECFERVFDGFKGSSQHVGWSANLRMRTVRAMTFLEATGLVVNRGGRLFVSDRGRLLLARANRDSASDLAYTIGKLERAYRDISVERQIALGL